MTQSASEQDSCTDPSESKNKKHMVGRLAKRRSQQCWPWSLVWQLLVLPKHVHSAIPFGHSLWLSLGKMNTERATFLEFSLAWIWGLEIDRVSWKAPIDVMFWAELILWELRFLVSLLTTHSWAVITARDLSSGEESAPENFWALASFWPVTVFRWLPVKRQCENPPAAGAVETTLLFCFIPWVAPSPDSDCGVV